MESTHTQYTHSGVRNLATQDTRTHNNEVSCAAVLEFALVRWAGVALTLSRLRLKARVARTTKSIHSVFASNIGTHTRQQRTHSEVRCAVTDSGVKCAELTRSDMAVEAFVFQQ